MRKFFSLFAAVLFAGSMMAETFTKTAYADLQTGDLVIITEQKGDDVFAASNDQGTSKAPVATAVTVSNDAITTDATNILWTVVKDGDNISFKTGNDYLYCTNTNNGVRVGSNSNKVFSIKDAYLYNNATSRYLGVYNSADFRCYTSVNANIKDQTLAFYAIAGAGEQPGDTVPVVPEDTTVVPLADPTNCAEAAEAALSVSANNELYNGGKEYTINGYVTSIAYAWKSGNMSFWMADAADGGNVLEAYKCAIANEADAVLVGDKVAVTGKLTKYSTTPEFAEGCTVQILERAQQDTTVTPVDTTVVPIDTTVVPVAGTEVVITYAGAYDNQATLDGVPVVQDGVTVTFAKGTGTSTPAYYNTGTGARTYGGNTITVDAGSNTITKIAFDFSQNNKDYTVNVGAYVKANSEWTGSASSVLFTTESGSGHNRIKSITVTLGEGGGDQPGGDTTVVPVDTTSVVPVVADPTNCAEAREAALSVSANNEEYNGGKEYTIQGYVTEIAFAYDATKGNMSFWMADTKDGGKVLEAYKCTITSEENAPAVGDKVAVTGKLTKYNTTPEFATGCTVVIIEKAGGDTPGGDTTIVVTDPTNCAEAATAALSVSKNNEEYNGGKEYTIEGYVTEIAFAYDATKGNMSFWMADTKDGGKVLEAYKCTITNADSVPAVGDKVAVTGKLTKYNTTPEFATGCTVVIIEKAGGDTPGGDTTIVVTDPTNCAEAREAALSVSKNNELYNGGKEYTIEGYVTAIQTPFSASNKNITFWMADAVDGGNVLQAYRAACQTAEDAPSVGDKVAVTGKLTKYNSTPEFATGCTFVIKEKSAPAVNLGPKTIGEFLALKNAKDTCVISGVVTSIQNTTYGNLYLADEKDTVYIYGVLTAEGVSKQFESLNVKVNDTLTVKAVYGEYNNAPQVSNAIFVEVKKAPAQDINVNMSDGLVYSDYVAAEGWWQIYGSNEKFDVSISNVSTTQAEGTYTISDLDADYTYVGVINGNDTNYVSFVDGSVTLSIDAQTGNVTVAGTLVGDDGNNYILNLQFIVPTPQETVNVNIQNGELIDDYADYGLYGVYGTDANDIYVQFAIWAENGFQGQFTEEDLDLQYIGSGIYEGEEQVEIYKAAITVTPGNGGDYTITATVLGYNNKQYNVTMYVPATATGIEETIATGKAVKTISNGMLLIEKAGVKYSVLGQAIR